MGVAGLTLLSLLPVRPWADSSDEGTAGTGEWMMRVRLPRSCMKKPIMVEVGYYQTRGGLVPFEIDASLPTWLLGKTRTGKSTGMLSGIVGTIHQGHGCLVADPHGPLADAVLHHIPTWRLKDVVIIDPTKHRVPGVGFFNMSKPTLSVEWFLNIIELQSGNFWGPQTAEILLAITLAVLERYKKPTILHIYKALARPDFCKTLLSKSKNPIVVDFHDKWFGKDMKAKDRLQAFTHPLNKIIVFLRDGIKEVVCQPDALDFAELMDQNKIIIVRLPKGEIGETATRIIGSLVIFNILLSASQRKGTNHFPLFIDEIHNFLDGIPFELMLAELAKWNITPFFATQTMQQMRDETRRIFNDKIALGNVATLAAFRISGDDADAVAKFAGYEDQASALVKLSNYTFACSTVKNTTVDWNFPISTYAKLKTKAPVPYEKVLAWAIENNGTEKETIQKYVRQELKREIAIAN